MREIFALAALGAVLGATDGSALAQTRQVVGTAGYLTEWEISGTVAKIASTTADEFTGSVVWKHVGLCSVNGPEEKRGVLRLQIRKSWLVSKVEASLSLDGDQCNYLGEFTNGTSGLMDCSNAKGIPLALSIK